jgi:hypothetical protein
MMFWLWITLALLVVLAGYIRLAPSDPARWNVPPDVTENVDLEGGAKRIVETGPDGLARLALLAADTPRTEVLAGSVEQGMMTFVSRSKIMGFPDYTTAQQDGDRLKLYARLRFGRSDLGVNRARLERWVDALQP